MASASEHTLLDLLTDMTAESIEASSLDARSLMLARIAALVAVNAPAGSYLLNLGAAEEAGLDVAAVQGVLAAIAPIVGAPRIASAVAAMADAYGLAIELEQE